MRPASLRNVVRGVVVLLGGVSLLTSASLLLLTSWLNHASVQLAQHVESVSITEHAVRDLVLHVRSVDPGLRSELGQRLHADVEATRTIVTSESEGVAAREAELAVNAYLADPSDDARYERAYEALDRLAAVNVEQAHVARAEASRWDRMGTALGLVGGISVPAVLLFTFVWLERAIGPVFRIGEAMGRYGRGDRDARAPEVGPAEVRGIAESFNALASTLARQRETQLTFLAGVAHDLRNPLMALRMATQLVRRYETPPDAATLHKVVDAVGRQVDHLDRMVGDLLDEARIQSGRFALQLAEHDVRHLAREVVDLVAEAGSSHRIVLHVPDGPVMLRCDATRIEQTLTNLVTNAVKYSPPGEVSVTVGGGPGEVRVEVSDHGAGIAPDQREALFEPFQRGAPGRGPEVPGAGLGLYVSRRIVEAHGGRLEVAGAPGGGSTFVVRIPGSALPA